MRTPTTPTVQRAVALALTLLFTLVFTTTAFAVPAGTANTGGDHGVCGDGLWLKADWTGEGWDWETGPGWTGDAPTTPVLTVTSVDDGDPLTVDWTSDQSVRAVSVKASTEYASYDGGYAGTVTGIDKTDDPSDGQHAISHIVFCYDEVEPPLVPSIGLEKAPDVTTVTYDPDGDPTTVTYAYTVTNTGQTPLTAITLVDDVLGSITLATTDLAVGGSTTGTATHTVTAADAAAGQIINLAEVTGTAPDQTTVTDTATATVLVQEVAPQVLEPGISLTKTALVTPDQNGRKVVVWSESTPTGTRITYEYVITNTGQTPLTAITLFDDVLGTITLTDTHLPVGGSMTVTATHVVSATDAAAGSITNQAVATATDPEGTEVQDRAAQTVFITTVKAEVIDRDQVEPEVIDRDEELPEIVDRDEELPVTGAAAMPLALAALLGVATGAGLLRVSQEEE